MKKLTLMLLVLAFSSSSFACDGSKKHGSTKPVQEEEKPRQ